MATVNLDWDSVVFRAADVKGLEWRKFKRQINIENHGMLLSTHAVYVIRTERPYAFQYENEYSPVAYIGKGNAQQRLTAHLKTWIHDLGSRIPDVGLRICFCEPRVRKLGPVCDHVEADLIDRFVGKYGELPLRNRNVPRRRGNHDYAKKQLSVLHPGQGKGYHWAIRPLRSSPFYK